MHTEVFRKGLQCAEVKDQVCLGPGGTIRSLSITINGHLAYVVQFIKSDIFNQARFALEKNWSKHLEHLWHYYLYLVAVMLRNKHTYHQKYTPKGYFFHLLQCWLYFLWLRGLCFCILGRFWGKVSRKKACFRCFQEMISKWS